jgi:hypothetical protein
VPYQYCPTCRLTVHAADDAASRGPCPRCGDVLAEDPRPLLGSPPTGVDPEAVRMLLAERGGRFQRRLPGRGRGGRFSPGTRRAA